MRYDWDVLNRATLIAQPSGGASYAYRADGQRIEKVEGATFSWSGPRTSGQYDTNYATNRPSSRYYYDGQMGFEDDYNPSGTVTQVNRYILGARGIDRVARTESGNTTFAYPMYDGHGNMRALLTRNGTSYSTGNWKTYDVWGSVRSGGSSGDPKQGYVASIGHVSDSESSLIYMRARYYEPAPGRFLSEDPAMDGLNWYVYCENEPITQSDPTGNNSEYASAWWAMGSLAAIAFCMTVIGTNNFGLWATSGAIAVGFYGVALAHTEVSKRLSGAFFAPFSEWVYTGLIAGYISSLAISLKSASRTKISAVGMKAIFVMVGYALSVLAAIAWTWEDVDASTP